MDNRKNNGSKVGALEKGVKAGDFPFIKLFLEYRYGKPKQQIEIEGGNTFTPIVITGMVIT